jgi:hypothetical protein
MDKVTEIADFVDYAHPTMKAERALKALHEAALEKNWCEAREQALQTIRWATEAHAALRVMEQKS